MTIKIRGRTTFSPHGLSFLTSPSPPRTPSSLLLLRILLTMEHSVSFLPQMSPQETIPKILIENNEMTENDIYRGAQYPPFQASGTESASSRSPSSFTASSNSFRLAGGRLGAIATRLERAITRWARANWADSSSSLTADTSSDSSRSSFRTANKSTRRKRRRPSVADIQQRVQSERAVAARLQAREARRTIPREFNLYSPSENDPSHNPGPVEERQEVVRTFSLDLVLPHLENLLRRHGKSRRPRHHHRRAVIPELDIPHQPHLHHPHRGHTPRDEAGKESRANAPDGSHKLEKGKDKMPSAALPPLNPPKHPSIPLKDPEAGKPPPAWWLDVANPSWEDMKTLGRVSTSFHLNEMSSQLWRVVITSSPPDAGGHSTTRAARKIGIISQAWLLFHCFPRSRILDCPRASRRHQSEDRQFSTPGLRGGE